MDITELTVHELQEKLKNKELTITEITKAYTDRIKEKEKDVQAFVTILTKEANEQAKQIEEKFVPPTVAFSKALVISSVAALKSGTPNTV